MSTNCIACGCVIRDSSILECGECRSLGAREDAPVGETPLSPPRRQRTDPRANAHFANVRRAEAIEAACQAVIDAARESRRLRDVCADAGATRILSEHGVLAIYRAVDTLDKLGGKT